MKVDNKKLYDLLKREKVSNLFHANTVATSITFIEEGGLLSRQDIEERSLYQTPQTSDGIDKLFDVFGDIFIDTTDLHKHFSRQNHYGPVLFKFGLELLLDDGVEVWVTKNNPIHWDRKSDPVDNYFQSVEELSENWGNYDIQKKMLTIRKPKKPISFNYLEEIVLDDPKLLVYGEISLRDESRKALEEATKGNPQIQEALAWRECGNCFCKDNYLKQVLVPELVRKFLPTHHANFEE